jgi:hypothetical protein
MTATPSTNRDAEGDTQYRPRQSTPTILTPLPAEICSAPHRPDLLPFTGPDPGGQPSAHTGFETSLTALPGILLPWWGGRMASRGFVKVIQIRLSEPITAGCARIKRRVRRRQS